MIGNYNYGTGRRKSAVARVFIKKGTGGLPVLQTISTVATETLSATVLQGKKIFYNAADSRRSSHRARTTPCARTG